MRIDFLALRTLFIRLLLSLWVLGMWGCAQTDQRFTSAPTHVEKLPVLKVTPVVISTLPASVDPSSNVNQGAAPVLTTPQAMYDVAFDYHGQSFVSRLPFDPGAWVWVTSRVAPLSGEAASNAQQNPAPSTANVSVLPEPLPSQTSTPTPVPTNLQSISGPVFGSALETPVAPPLYVLPPGIEASVYPVVYSSFYMAAPAFFYAGGYYPYHYRSHFYGNGHAVHGGGRGGHGRR